MRQTLQSLRHWDWWLRPSRQDSRLLFPFEFLAGMKQQYAAAGGPTTNAALKTLPRITARPARTSAALTFHGA